jgi:3D (Asp-Asp-Asp) domain-containing protein
MPRALFDRRALVALLSVAIVMSAEACAGRMRPASPAKPVLTRRPQSFTATAYCHSKYTAAGTKVTVGTAAADPRVLPIGSVIMVGGLDKRYNGRYTVLDTGPNIRGYRLDIYMRDCRDAVRFGRQRVQVMLLSRSD